MVFCRDGDKEKNGRVCGGWLGATPSSSVLLPLPHIMPGPSALGKRGRASENTSAQAFRSFQRRRAPSDSRRRPRRPPTPPSSFRPLGNCKMSAEAHACPSRGAFSAKGSEDARERRKRRGPSIAPPKKPWTNGAFVACSRGRVTPLNSACRFAFFFGRGRKKRRRLASKVFFRRAAQSSSFSFFPPARPFLRRRAAPFFVLEAQALPSLSGAVAVAAGGRSTHLFC